MTANIVKNTLFLKRRQESPYNSGFYKEKDKHANYTSYFSNFAKNNFTIIMSEQLFDDLHIFHSLANELITDFNEKGISSKINSKDLLQKFNLSLNNEGLEDKELKELLKDLILHTPKTSGKLFFNQLFGGLNSKAVLGDLLAVLLNNSMATYKIAGPMVEVEKEILRKISQLISYPDSSGGTLPTGGSMSNFMALIISRDKKCSKSRISGNTQNLICYTSENSHYSIGKNASFSGIGRENVRYIKTNEKGEMIPDLLRTEIEKDKEKAFIPFFVNATLGTTVMGAIDPIYDISKICKQHDLWLHIDGCYSGSVIFSKKYKHFVKGIEHSDSFCFNPHKTLGTPLSTSIFLVKNQKDLHDSFSNKAEYLYQTDDDEYNLGQTSFECGRRNNALKFWTLWKSVGTNGIAKMVDQNYHLANVARDYVTNNKDYTLYSFEDSLSVCFNYKNYDPKIICTELYNHNKLMIGYGKHKGNEFIRLVSINRENSEENILNVFKVIETFCKNNL